MEIDEWRKAVAIPRTRWTEVNDYVSTLYLKKLMGRGKDKYAYNRYINGERSEP